MANDKDVLLAFQFHNNWLKPNHDIAVGLAPWLRRTLAMRNGKE